MTLGFTEPYLFDQPLQAGLHGVHARASTTTRRGRHRFWPGPNLTRSVQSTGPAEPAELRVAIRRASRPSLSYPLKRSFARLGISYGYTIQNVNTLTDAATSYYTYLNFLNINGPNQLDGIKSSTITPSFTYNTVNHPITPTAGKALSASLQFSGSFLGGNVNQIEPVIDAKYFRNGFDQRETRDRLALLGHGT